MKTNVAAAIALAAVAAASPLSSTAARVHTRPFHITITSTEVSPEPTDVPNSSLGPFNPFNQEPGPVIDPNFTNLPLETTPAAPATTSVPGGGGDDDDDDEPDAGGSICLLPEGCGPDESEDPPSMTDLLCFIPEGCKVQLRTGAVITIPAGQPIPTALLRPTARRGHHDNDDDDNDKDRPVIITTTGPHRPIRTGKGRGWWPAHPPRPDCEKDKGAFGCASELPPGNFITLGSDEKGSGPEPIDVTVPPGKPVPPTAVPALD